MCTMNVRGYGGLATNLLTLEKAEMQHPLPEAVSCELLR